MPLDDPEEARAVVETALTLSGVDRHRFLTSRCPDEPTRRTISLVLEAIETSHTRPSHDRTGPAPASPDLSPTLDHPGSRGPTRDASGRAADETIPTLDSAGRYRETGEFGALWSGLGPSADGALRIGNFRIVRTLGSGGMGTVFEAIDERLGRRVALKTIRAEWRFDARATARLMREAQLLAALEHPHICRLYDALHLGDGTHLVLEFVDGRPLGAAAAELSRPQRLRVAEQVASAIAAAHAAGVVHRDLKPDNVMITPGGEAKVLDFGIARPTTASLADVGTGAASDGGSDEQVSRSGVDMASALMTIPGALMGTPLYMSPEQASGAEATPASDMFAFGLLLQELFTGERAFDRSGDREALLARVRRAELRPMRGGPRPIAALVRDLTALNPAQRPTAVDAVRRLAALRRRPVRLALAAAAGVAILLGVGGALKYTIDLAQERSQAVAARGDAEDLMGFMTETLRDQLAAVGRLDAMGSVAERVIGYYGGRDLSHLGDAELARYAKGLTLIGEVQFSRDQADLDSAERAFRDAQRLLEQLAARDGTNGPVLKSLGAVRFWLGNVAIRRLRTDDALAEFEAYLALAERLVALDADSAEWQLELAYAHSNLITVHRQRKDPEAAKAALDASLVAKRRLMELRPGDPETARSLANGLTYLAQFRAEAGDSPGAHDAFAEALEVIEGAMRANPRDAETAYRRVALHLLHGELHAAESQHRAALGEFLAAQDAARGLLAIDPTNTTWQRDMSLARRRAGQSHHALGDRVAAHQEYQASRTILAALVERDPSRSAWLDDLAGLDAGIARLALDDGRWSDARIAATQAYAASRELARRATSPGARGTMVVLAARWTLLEAKAAEGQGELTARDDLHRRAVAELDATGAFDGAPPDVVTERDRLLTMALLRVGDRDRADPLLARLRSQGQCTDEVEAVAAAVGAP